MGRYSSGAAWSRFKGPKSSRQNCQTAAAKTTHFQEDRCATSPAASTGAANPKNVNPRNTIHASGTRNNVNRMKIFVAHGIRLLPVNCQPIATRASGPHQNKLRQNSPHGAVSNAPPSQSSLASQGKSEGF